MSGAAQRFAAQTGAKAALGFLALAIVAALLAPLIAPYDPNAMPDPVALQNLAPRAAHLFGTDLYSRDVLSRVIFGARVSLGVGALATAVALLLGAAVGAAAGYFRRGVDAVLMRLVDVGLAVPRIFLVLVAIAAGIRLGTVPLALLLGGTGWFATSRLVRADVLVLRERAFVDAARALGASPGRVIIRHVLPNTAGTLIVSAALGVAHMMLLEAGLSFLGAGVQPPTASWGNMIADARDQLTLAPWSSLFPGLAITAVVMSLNLVADALQHALDPRQNATMS